MIRFQDGNFWQLYPVYKHKEPFRTIYKKYKRGKKSSDMAWYVFLFADSKSEFFTYPEDVRQHELEMSYPNTHTIKEVQYAIDVYDDHMCSADERAFKQWTKKLQERATFLESLDYSDLELAQVKTLDQIMIDSNKIWDAYSKIEEKYEKTKSEISIMGGGSESFLEKA